MAGGYWDAYNRNQEKTMREQVKKQKASGRRVDIKVGNRTPKTNDSKKKK